MSLKDEINNFGDSLKDFITSKDHLKEGLSLGSASATLGLSGGVLLLGISSFSNGQSGLGALATGLGIGILAAGTKLSVDILNLEQNSNNWKKTFEMLKHDKHKQLNTDGSLSSHVGQQATNIVHNIAVKLGLPIALTSSIAGAGAGVVAGASVAFCGAGIAALNFPNMAVIGASALASVGLGMVTHASFEKSDERTREIKFNRDNSNELSL